MEEKTIAGLIAIAAIVAVVIFAGCIGPTTTIYDIEEHPDKYIGKRVTIEANPGRFLFFTVEDTFGGLKGFWIHDKEPRSIFVAYDGDCPSTKIKDEWGRETSYPIKVTGIVRHTYIRMGFEEIGVFYIEGESWEYID